MLSCDKVAGKHVDVGNGMPARASPVKAWHPAARGDRFLTGAALNGAARIGGYPALEHGAFVLACLRGWRKLTVPKAHNSQARSWRPADAPLTIPVPDAGAALPAGRGPSTMLGANQVDSPGANIRKV